MADNFSNSKQRLEHDEDEDEDQDEANNNNNATTPKTSKQNLQMKALLQALENGTLSRTYGQHSKDQVLEDDEVVKFMRDKYIKMQLRCKEIPTFDYLKNHTIGSTTASQVQEAEQLLTTQYSSCLPKPDNIKGYQQLKFADISRPCKPSDKAGCCGLIQIQAYNIGPLIPEDGKIQTLKDNINRWLRNSEELYMVGGHLCKRRCITKGHQAQVSSKTNTRNHETCPSFWLINGTPQSFCTCHEDQAIKCLRPGPDFHADRFSSQILADHANHQIKRGVVA